MDPPRRPSGRDRSRLSPQGRGHQRGAWSAAVRFLGDGTEAEDVTQEVFLKILTVAPRYRPTAPFRAYLYRVVTRLCLDRAEKKRPEYTDALPEAADSTPGPVETLIGKERQAAVQRALGTLPDTQWVAVILEHFQDLSYAQISAALGVTPKAVEGLLGLAVTGLGLSILWPRILTVALWGVMLIFYYLLARDEERRMLGQFGNDCRGYRERTGMFLPKGIETAAGKVVPGNSAFLRGGLMVAVLAVGAVCAALGLRAYTVDSLPLWSNGAVTTVAILPNDLMVLDHRMAEPSRSRRSRAGSTSSLVRSSSTSCRRTT